MIEFPLTDWETMRLTALYQLEILDTAPEKEFDHIVALAALVCECPMATIGFLDLNRTWYKAAIGLNIKETPADKAYEFSDQQELSAIQIEDTLWDGRLLYKTIFPLYTEEGGVLGHLSVANTKPGFLTTTKIVALEMLALQTISLLKLRLQFIKMRHVAYQSKRTLDQISPVFKNAIDSVLVIAQDGLIVQWNPRAEVMFGYKAEQAIGLYFHDLLIPTRSHESFWNKRRGLDVHVDSPFTKDNYEFVAKRIDDTELLVAMGISPVFIDGENLFIAFLSDITAREQNALEQNCLLEQLSFRNAQLIDFCNIVTHNLRGPLHNMSLLVDFVADANDLQEQLELVSKLKPVIGGLKTTFDELVETIQVKQNTEIKSEMVELHDCLKKTMNGLEMEMILAKAQIAVDFTQAPEVFFPPKYIASIFYNLLSNSLKYRSPVRDLKINVATTRKDGVVTLTFADNGLGIDLVKYHDQVFEIGKVFHCHENAKGLGLYMTKTQVEVMGGKISVESEVDKGATFIVGLNELRKIVNRS